jgi:hypothetical protein
MNTNISLKPFEILYACKKPAGAEKPNQDNITTENAENTERTVPEIPFFHAFRGFQKFIYSHILESMH